MSEKPDTIKTVTTCPTCGGECEVRVDGKNHYYVPKDRRTLPILKESKDIDIDVVDAVNEHFLDLT